MKEHKVIEGYNENMPVLFIRRTHDYKVMSPGWNGYYEQTYRVAGRITLEKHPKGYRWMYRKRFLSVASGEITMGAVADKLKKLNDGLRKLEDEK